MKKPRYRTAIIVFSTIMIPVFAVVFGFYFFIKSVDNSRYSSSYSFVRNVLIQMEMLCVNGKLRPGMDNRALGLSNPETYWAGDEGALPKALHARVLNQNNIEILIPFGMTNDEGVSLHVRFTGICEGGRMRWSVDGDIPSHPLASLQKQVAARNDSIISGYENAPKKIDSQLPQQEEKPVTVNKKVSNLPSTSLAPLDNLASARDRWAATNLKDYDIEIHRQGNRGLDQRLFLVRAGVISDIYKIVGLKLTTGMSFESHSKMLLATVPGLFDFIETELPKNNRSYAQYHPVSGYPVTIRILHPTSDWEQYRISLYESGTRIDDWSSEIMTNTQKFNTSQDGQLSGHACTPVLAGKGRKARNSCFDAITGDQGGPKMVIVPAGGSFKKPFAIGKYELTIKDINLYCNLSGRCPPRDEKEIDRPITGITIEDAMNYALWLSERASESNQTAVVYRLPTNAEWEYSANADGTHDLRTNCKLRNIKVGVPGPHKVQTGIPNSWGLLNYVGNVREWVLLPSGGYAARGGSFNDYINGIHGELIGDDVCSVSLETPHDGTSDRYTGVRLVRELD